MISQIVTRAVFVCTLASVPAVSFAQTVVEVQGGGSSLVDGYGATANFWRPGGCLASRDAVVSFESSRQTSDMAHKLAM